jgi:hypothetical protein
MKGFCNKPWWRQFPIDTALEDGTGTRKLQHYMVVTSDWRRWTIPN